MAQCVISTHRTYIEISDIQPHKMDVGTIVKMKWKLLNEYKIIYSNIDR